MSTNITSLSTEPLRYLLSFVGDPALARVSKCFKENVNKAIEIECQKFNFDASLNIINEFTRVSKEYKRIFPETMQNDRGLPFFSHQRFMQMDDEIAKVHSTLILGNELSDGEFQDMQEFFPAERAQMFSRWISNHPQKIEELELTCQKLRRVPQEIVMLNSLLFLTLDSNMIQTLPKSISQLTSLEMLNVTNNELQTLPEEIGMLTNLQCLELSENRLQNLPNALIDLCSLIELTIDSNQFTILPEIVFSLTTLKHLTIDNNPIPIDLTMIRRFKILSNLQDLTLPPILFSTFLESQNTEEKLIRFINYGTKMQDALIKHKK
ncbi:MAG: leucine-rich repeat domain-containing protein [Simkaniaceae bacterium]|nr:leucine-rich repeat domain-containing protein [Simkaniaceae bacterium]